MVIASVTAESNERISTLEYPVVDLSWKRGRAAELLVRACEEFGFVKVVNHGVPRSDIAKMEAEGARFFALPPCEKQKAGPPTPLGYGIRSIGFNGDMGELEYLLLHSNPSYISQKAKTICRKDPIHFSGVVNEYVKQVRQLACQLLDMVGEGLGLQDTRVFSRLLQDSENDSLVRLNHYPPWPGSDRAGGDADRDPAGGKSRDKRSGGGRIGFGEHSDPQILSILRSNDVDGLQILSAQADDGGVWIPVPADPVAFYVIVGDALQAMTNGRLVSVRHRAMANSCRPRTSTVFFGAPSPGTRITPLPQMIKPDAPRRYKSFTWAEYKKAMYSLRLGHNRLDLFLADPDDHDQESGISN
ncbi:gibberellin [Musa troglodytarum]|uniref:gibberellin 2beta-dioxygenase n=1 Tax=Musa troglodytarum TaxID=320322 RepID=A0A9E7JHX9_9LILI|nr:gibberellin [Musa troglodytarum]